MKGVYFDLLDLMCAKTMLLHQAAGALNRGLRPAANGVGFVILLAHVPPLTKICPITVGFFDGDGGSACKSLSRELGGSDPCHGAPARPVFEHSGMINAAHHLAPRAVIFSDAKCMPGFFR